MKVILEIPDEEVEIIKRNGFNKDGTFSFKLNEVVKQAIRNGVILPDNATNGDVIKALFPDCERESRLNEECIEVMGAHRVVDRSWWDAPYEKYKKENVE